MAKQHFNFTLRREALYRLVRPRRSPPRKPDQSFEDYLKSLRDEDFKPMRIVGNGKRKGSIRISNHPMLFKEFSEIGPMSVHHEEAVHREGLKEEPEYLEYWEREYLEGSDNALRDFVQRYGRLTDDKEGDNVYLLLDEAGEMKHLLKVFERHKRRMSVQVPDLKATAALDPKTGNIEIRLSPQTLLQALWLQLIYFLFRGGGELRKCQRPGCTKSFSIGSGTKRSDARFCSKECQVLFNSRKRSNPALRGKRK